MATIKENAAIVRSAARHFKAIVEMSQQLDTSALEQELGEKQKALKEVEAGLKVGADQLKVQHVKMKAAEEWVAKMKAEGEAQKNRMLASARDEIDVEKLKAAKELDQAKKELSVIKKAISAESEVVTKLNDLVLVKTTELRSVEGALAKIKASLGG